MAKGDMTLIDIYVDAADNAELERLNKAFDLRLTRIKRWWWFEESNASYRERVREGIRENFNQ